MRNPKNIASEPVERRRMDPSKPSATATRARKSGIHLVPAFDVEKIARLRTAIKDGSLEVDAERIAAAIVEHGG